MKTSPQHPSHPFPPGVQPAAPPPELRERVLRAADAPEPGPQAPWWARPALRWAWAAAMALVLAGHLYLSLSRPAGPSRAVTTPPPAASRHLLDDPILACCPGLVQPAPKRPTKRRDRQLVERLLKGELS